MTRATVITDASFDNRRKIGGWAAWIRVDDLPNPIKGFGTFSTKPQSSVEAEVMAALNGMFIACNRGATVVLVRSDCMAVQHLILRRCTAPGLNKVWDRALSSPWAHGITKIESQHIKAHKDPNRSAAAWVNNWCDTKAKRGLRAARSGKSYRHIVEERNFSERIHQGS